ncbi:hypothetical protein B0H15DRAFT_799228 [Mycena belliarum]|uniref:Uncharacterized protein n=1 Tax=Mycena belliarum TaxID=1033014 RepID=A0AAD6XT52_9AGAR|nr:hypothetical protein B0H15DRAFT_799228 [Mycena belliae]
MESLTTFTFESAKILSTTLLSRDSASVKYTTSSNLTSLGYPVKLRVNLWEHGNPALDWLLSEARPGVLPAGNHFTRNKSYTTSTVRKGSSRQSTSLVGAPGSPDTEIDWKRNTFTISGETRHVGELRKKRATFSSCAILFPRFISACANHISGKLKSRYWSWFECEEYRVKYDSELENTWMVSSYSGTVLATFSSNIHRVFHGNSLPALNLSSSIHDEDKRRFIILVLLYSEIKRLESLRAVAIDFIGRRNTGL